MLVDTGGSVPLSRLGNTLVSIFRRTVDKKCEVRGWDAHSGSLRWSSILDSSSGFDAMLSVSRAGSKVRNLQ